MSASAATKTILVATATDAVRNRFTAALRDAGHRARGVDGAQALLGSLSAGVRAADLLLLDLALGDLTLVSALRERAAGLPIVVFSGSVSAAGEVRTLATLGVSGYVNEHTDDSQILPALAPHLFPDSFNRRGSPRVDLAIPVSYRVDTMIGSALTLNLGKGGLAIRTMTPLEASTRLRIRFRLPGSDSDVEADSRVVWRDRRVGMGLQFEQVDAADQAAVDEYIDLQHLDRDGWSAGNDPP
jgi:uncharacterized protein (TIGR02266 family)